MVRIRVAHFGTVDWMVRIRVALKEFGEYALVAELATNCVCVAYHGPLFKFVFTCNWFEGHDLSKIVKKSNEMEPVMLRPLCTDALCCLEVMNAVWLLVVGIGIVNELVQHLDHLHHCKLTLVECKPSLMHVPNKIYILFLMIQPVEV